MIKDNIYRVIEYIEDHITEPLSVEQLAQISGYSFYYFTRSFRKHTGLSTSEYIRRQRLASAAYELLSDVPTSDVSAKYGYDTPSGFSKAFRKYYGMSPSEYKAKYEKNPHPEYESLPELNAVAFILTPPEDNFDLSKGGAYWYHKSFPDSTADPEQWSKMSLSDIGEIGAWLHTKNGLQYALGPVVTGDSFVPDGMHPITIPAADYAVFEVPRCALCSELHRHILSLWNTLYKDWFVSDKLHFDEGKVAFECYRGTNTYIYVPVVLQ